MSERRRFQGNPLLRRTAENKAKIEAWKSSLLLKSNFTDDSTRAKELVSKAKKFKPRPLVSKKDGMNGSRIFLLAKEAARRCGIFGRRRADIVNVWYKVAILSAYIYFSKGRERKSLEKELKTERGKFNKLLGPEKDQFLTQYNNLSNLWSFK